ncbi:alpha/beta hydrolase [Mediterraneibacter faecis]
MHNFMKSMFLKQREEFDQETKVRNAKFQIPDDIKLVENVPYLNDGCPAHTMDIYRPAKLVPSRPVIINVHGGGLMEGSKEFNRRFCVQLCRQNFVIFSVEYRLIPDVTVYEQFNDISRAMDAVKSLMTRYQGNPNQVYMVGDSAGAYLAVYAVAMQNSPELAVAAHVHPSTLQIQAMGLISGMFYTRKLDKIGLFLPNFLYGSRYRKTSFAPYTNPEHPAITKNLPPCYLVTSKNDMLQHYTLNFAKALKKHNAPYHLQDFPANKALTHAFSVFEPEMPESIKVIHDMSNFLRHFPEKI